MFHLFGKCVVDKEELDSIKSREFMKGINKGMDRGLAMANILVASGGKNVYTGQVNISVDQKTIEELVQIGRSAFIQKDLQAS